MTKPFVKHVGGKTRLLPDLLRMLPDDLEHHTYCEPFLGGGALYFELFNVERIRRSAILRDKNRALINTYVAVRDDVETVIENCGGLFHGHDAEQYELARDAFNASMDGATSLSPTEHAAIYIYLNKTCFNGLYRVNRHGHFNVPIGAFKGPRAVDAESLRKASSTLAGAVLECASFEDLPSRLENSSFVYLDPPYMPIGNQSFTSYTAGGFGLEDQQRLRRVFGELNLRGHKLMLSNSSAARSLYEDGGYRIDTVRAPRSVNSRGTGRGLVEEIVVRNY